MLLDKARAALGIATRTPRHRLNEDFHLASDRDAEQTEPEQAAELAHTRIMLAASAPPGGLHGEPDLVAGSRAVHGLQDELERDTELQLADDHRGGLLAVERYEVAAAHLALDLEAQLFEEALDGQVEARFQGVPSASARIGKPLAVIRHDVQIRIARTMRPCIVSSVLKFTVLTTARPQR